MGGEYRIEVRRIYTGDFRYEVRVFAPNGYEIEVDWAFLKIGARRLGRKIATRHAKKHAPAESFTFTPNPTTPED